MRKFLLLILLVSWAISASLAQAATTDYIEDRAYFEDASNQLTFPQIKEKPFTAFNGMLSKGYSQSTYWVRLKISAANENALDKPLVLKIQPTYLDEIQLYDPAEPTKLNRVLGDRHPYINNERKSLTYDFLIPASEKERDVWLRLKTSSTNLMQLSVVSEADAIAMDRKFDAATAAILSALLVFIFWAIVHWWSTGDRLVGIFILRQLSGLGFFLAYVGFIRIWLAGMVPPPMLDVTTSFFVLLSSTAAIWFHWEFFKEYLIGPRWHAVFKFTLALFPIEIALFMLGKLTLALTINMVMVLVLPTLMFLMSLFAVPWDRLKDSVSALPRRYFVLAHAMYFLVTSLATLPSLALASGSIFSPHTVLMHAFLTAIVLISMVYYRANRIEERRAVDVALARQSADNERAKREEQGRFLEMLTHEFKTSLAVLKMALGSLDIASKEGRYANRAIDNMNDVIERCRQVQALSDEQVLIDVDEIDLMKIISAVVIGSHVEERICVHGDASVKVKTDEKLLKVIISNLIDNALKYSKPLSVVDLRVEAEGPEVLVTVSNQVGNAGMPDKDKVFSKYYRSERAHEQIGSGLGLYLMAQLAQMLGIRLRYVPKPEFVEFELCLKQST
jgi:two-component system, sensor histidine kinase LadS